MDATAFAQKWIQSWNSHDLDDIMSHYSDDLEVTTPMIRIATGLEADTLKGKQAAREYWRKGLESFPDLKFELLDVTAGVDSVALYYKSVMDKRSIEVMFFNAEGLVCKMFAHYT